MKFRIAIPRKVLLGAAGVLLMLGGGAGGAAYFGFLPMPWGGEAELRGSVDEKPAAHGEKAAQGEHAAPAEGEHAAPAEGEHAAPAEGEHAAPAEGEHAAPAEGEHAAPAEGEHAAPAEGEHAAAEGEHGAAGGEHGGAVKLPDIVYDLPQRSNFTKSVRALMQAQSAAALGSSDQVGSQREAISKIQIELQTFDTKTARPSELEALGIYLLSGGNPRGLASMIDDIPSTSPLKEILRGAFDYVVAETDKAKKSLLDVDLGTVSPALAARIALAQSALADPADFAAQAAALKRAAGYAPGTLVEEAAYRRLVSLALKSEDARSFVRYSRRYIRRFPKSLYIGEFLQSYGQGLLHFEEQGHPPPRIDLDSLLHILPHEVARKLVLDLGKQSAKRGLRDLCLHVSANEFSRYMDDAGDVQRLHLYALVCNVVEEPERSRYGLRAMFPEGLPNEDKALRQDALRLADGMLGDSKDDGEDKVAGPELPDSDTTSTVVSAAQQLQASEELLKEALQ